ncbi:uncharacterized protein BDR25DRAFT_67899 [Lindgomyces ingoldianus]|uniref:Uncharacterized protein n=1 Tax=Lindgomyces ingoldianus TaxID=673940 RepID=A0ACB6RE75_9PLEO|nr:uncharacterized protein BDR25DRAFT_67899 [Lindgomyces ingoldianus]KAF2476632.1 hypothetical protein BDR25DRAFT_67899 [Lindgomyces ingoldianus]
MESSTAFPTLHKINVLTFFPAFAFLLPAGILSSIIPPMGIIPMFFSFLNGVAHLLRPRNDIKKKSCRWFTHPIWDFAICLADLGVLLPLWIIDTQRTYYGWHIRPGPMLLLEYYGSVFLMVNMCIHAYLFLASFNWKKLSLPSIGFQRECPHCAQREERDGLLANPVTKSMGKGPRYSLLGGDGEYRDESAESTPRPSQEVQEV